MDEKTMVNDILEELKFKLSCYQKAIVEAENIELRQTLKQLRDNIESFHYELFKIASASGYYMPTDKATPKQMQNAKNALENL